MRLGKLRLLLCTLVIATPLHSEQLSTIDGFSKLTKKSQQSASAYNKRVGYCSDETQRDNPIPIEPKLFSLSFEKQKAIIHYLSEFNSMKCSESEKVIMLEHLLADPNSEQFMSFLRRMNIFEEFVPYIELTIEDWTYVNELSHSYQKPFNFMKAIDLIQYMQDQKNDVFSH